MKRGFYTIMLAQFFSSLADNAVFVVAVQLLKTQGAPAWQPAALVPMFALFYVVLAPFVGAFADAKPKGQVMFISNAIKVIGCLLMLTNVHPLMAYAVIGLGAAAYSPAKYGILTELLPTSQLVRANGWIEGLTISSIILGVLLGGQLIGPQVSGWLLQTDWPWVTLGINTAPKTAIAILVFVYALAAGFNTRIPRTGVALRALGHHTSFWRNIWLLVLDFKHCNQILWRDPLGQISLATTSLFWGVSGNLRYIVLAWSSVALGYSISQASALVGVVAIGTAAGAVLASIKVNLTQATRVIPLGIAMGVLVIFMNTITHVEVARPFLILLGGLGGFLVVPMNALLQHRGHELMGAGRSIAVQNFNEQLCILGLGLAYSQATEWGLSAFGAIAAFGVLVAGTMWLIWKWYQRNLKEDGDVIEALLLETNDEAMP
jgi:MFS transporter, LPLT family, lysophospholipid transporter